MDKKEKNVNKLLYIELYSKYNIAKLMNIIGELN